MHIRLQILYQPQEQRCSANLLYTGGGLPADHGVLSSQLYWMVGEYRNDEPEATDTDQWAVNNGYIAITPTKIDVTDYDWIKNFEH